MDSEDVKNVILYMLTNELNADATIPDNLTIVNSLNDEMATFPRIVFQELTISTNSCTLNHADYTKDLMYQIDIFAKEPAAETMCRRISKAVRTVLEKTIHLTQSGGGNIIKEDTTSKRYTTTYSGIFNEETGKFES